jgi:hypothetical protein
MFDTEYSTNPMPSSYDIHLWARRERSLAVGAILRGVVRKCGKWLRNLGRLGGWLTHMVAEAQLRRQVRELARLDDRMLRDIGLPRGEIEYVLRNGHPRRPSHVDLPQQPSLRQPPQDLRRAA